MESTKPDDFNANIKFYLLNSMAFDLAVCGSNGIDRGMVGTLPPVVPKGFMIRSFNGLHRDDKLWPKNDFCRAATPLKPCVDLREKWSRRHAKKMGQCCPSPCM